jgi:hypothetical protein
VTTAQRDVRDRVAAVPDHLATAALAAAREQTVPGEWTPTDIVRHLIAVEEEVWHPRLRQLFAQDEPHWAWAEPDRWQGAPGAPLDELLAVHRALRLVTVGLLDDLGEAGWSKTGVHATFGRLDAVGLMEKALDHDAEHLASLGAEPGRMSVATSPPQAPPSTT